MALSGSLQFAGKAETTILIRDMVPDLALTGTTYYNQINSFYFINLFIFV